MNEVLDLVDFGLEVDEAKLAKIKDSFGMQHHVGAFARCPGASQSYDTKLCPINCSRPGHLRQMTPGDR